MTIRTYRRTQPQHSQLFILMPRYRDVYLSRNNSLLTQGTNVKVRQPWRERFGEQVVLLDWSILTGALIKIVSKSVTHLANLESQAEKSERM
jgi:hypothetical protein